MERMISKFCSRAESVRNELTRGGRPMNPADFEACAGCGYVAPAGERPQHIALMSIECKATGWLPIDLHDLGLRTAWSEYVDRHAEHRHARCTACAAQIRVLRSGRLVQHTRPRRDDERRRRPVVPCEGSRATAVDVVDPTVETMALRDGSEARKREPQAGGAQ